MLYARQTLPQQPPIDLTLPGFGQLVEKLKGPRNLVRRQPLPTKSFQLIPYVCITLRAVPERDERLDLQQSVLVLDPQRRALSDTGTLLKNAFDLQGRKQQPPHQFHFRLP